MAKILFGLEKTHPKFLKKICQNNSFQQNFHIGSQVKTRQSQRNKFKEFAKSPDFFNFEKNKNYTRHHTHDQHLLKLLDKMSEYEWIQ